MLSYHSHWLSDCPAQGGTGGFACPFLQRRSGLSAATCPQPLMGDIGRLESHGRGNLGNAENEPKTSRRVGNTQIYSVCMGKAVSPGCPALPSIGVRGVEEFGGFPRSCLCYGPGAGAGAEPRVPPGPGLKEGGVPGPLDPLGKVAHV